MAATAIDRATGLASSAAFKAPVYVATTANIALSGLLTIDGVVLTAGKRVLVKDQSVPAQNGIYLAATSDWQRAPDLTSNDSVREGTRVYVTDGATQAGTEYVVTTSDPISIGSSALTFTTATSLLNIAAVGAAIHAAVADTITDTDEIGFYEAVSGLLRKITWANFKTLLATVFLPLTGGTLTGNLSISKATPQVSVNKAASGQAANIAGMMNGAMRWLIEVGNTVAESGSNAGSYFSVSRYNDAGTYLDTPLSFQRDNDAMVLAKGQILFPATANSSSNANTLDDYERGTWTPRMSFNASESGVTYGGQVGAYVKIGRLVHIEGNVGLSSNGSGVGEARVLGLPFTAADDLAHIGFSYWGGTASVVGNLMGAISVTTPNAFSIRMSGGTASVTCTDTNITNSANMFFSGTYLASA